jgi:hypothetical protein
LVPSSPASHARTTSIVPMLESLGAIFGMVRTNPFKDEPEHEKRDNLDEITWNLKHLAAVLVQQ